MNKNGSKPKSVEIRFATKSKLKKGGKRKTKPKKIFERNVNPHKRYTSWHAFDVQSRSFSLKNRMGHAFYMLNRNFLKIILKKLSEIKISCTKPLAGTIFQKNGKKKPKKRHFFMPTISCRMPS